MSKKQRDAAKSEKVERDARGWGGGNFWSKKGRVTRDAIYEVALSASQFISVAFERSKSQKCKQEMNTTLDLGSPTTSSPRSY